MVKLLPLWHYLFPINCTYEQLQFWEIAFDNSYKPDSTCEHLFQVDHSISAERQNFSCKCICHTDSLCRPLVNRTFRRFRSAIRITNKINRNVKAWCFWFWMPKPRVSKAWTNKIPTKQMKLTLALSVRIWEIFDPENFKNVKHLYAQVYHCNVCLHLMLVTKIRLCARRAFVSFTAHRAWSQVFRFICGHKLSLSALYT